MNEVMLARYRDLRSQGIEPDAAATELRLSPLATASYERKFTRNRQAEKTKQVRAGQNQKGMQAVQLGDAYIALREGGMSSLEARDEMGLKPAAWATYESHYRATREGATDPSCPKFANGSDHVAAVLAAGGFPRAELRTIRGVVRAFLIGPDGLPWKEAA